MRDEVIKSLKSPEEENMESENDVSHFDFITLDLAPIVRKVAPLKIFDSYVRGSKKAYVQSALAKIENSDLFQDED